ncbi:DUF488 domain-containing protein [Luteolibacter marinus]|uniref:DUF488 domain-containing protein n=1 Tax=Luteolibacter marinus TaxID=2776705 RepID=UPI00186732B6|nr:DUF488 family protein [Luteolibacter marinus]
MIVGCYRYGRGRAAGGLRVGVARHVPRGVRKEDYVPGGYFDVWLPVLAPSAELVRAYQRGECTTAQFFRRYRGEMRGAEVRHVIALMAAMSIRTPIQLGCFCEDESVCHRSVLRELVIEALEDLPPAHGERSGCASPPCAIPDPEG